MKRSNKIAPASCTVYSESKLKSFGVRRFEEKAVSKETSSPGAYCRFACSAGQLDDKEKASSTLL